MKYLLDTNVFIEAKRRAYGFDICPAFWSWLEQANKSGIVHSVEEVAKELQRGKDELCGWSEERGRSFFLPVDESSAMSMQNVAMWVERQRYMDAAMKKFLSGADYYVVSQAKAWGCTVVTHELPRDGTANVKIPDVCKGIGVDCINTFQMLRRERVRFILGGPGSIAPQS